MRRLSSEEFEALVSRDVVAHLATVDESGYPNVTPIWFLWDDGLVRMTSFADRPHLDRIRANPRVGLVIDIEAELRGDGQRPNQQIRVVGDATVSADPESEWSQAIRRKYIDARIARDRPSGRERAVITLRPKRIVAVASV